MSRRRRNRRLLRTQDELCRVQLETDEILEAKESEVRELETVARIRLKNISQRFLGLERIVSIKKSRLLS